MNESLNALRKESVESLVKQIFFTKDVFAEVIVNEKIDELMKALRTN
jgi:hypothetical protein